MGTETSTTLPSAVAELLDGLDEQELQATIAHARRRLEHAHPTVTERIAAQSDAEIDCIEKRGGYTEVVKREPCGEACEGCPHAVLYHVTEEKHTDGSVKLHWKYLGRVPE